MVVEIQLKTQDSRKGTVNLDQRILLDRLHPKFLQHLQKFGMSYKPMEKSIALDLVGNSNVKLS